MPKSNKKSNRPRGSKSKSKPRGKKRTTSKRSTKGGKNNSLFKNYLSNLRNNLNGGTSNLFDQDGGGYSMNVGSSITNLPEVTKYSDCCPPALVNEQLVQSSGDSPVCSPNQYGGTKRTGKSKKRKSGKKTKKKSKGKKRKSTKRKKSSSKKTKRKSKKSKRNQSGGMNAEYPSSVSGTEGNFSGDMTTRQFGCRQPNWEQNCA